MSAEQLAWAFALGGGMVLLVGLSAAMLMREARRRDLEFRVAHTLGLTESGADGSSAGLPGPLAALTGLVKGAGRLYSRKDIDHFHGSIVAAGLDPEKVLPLLLGGKLLLTVLLPVVAAVVASVLGLSVQTRIIVIGVGVVVGLLGPEKVLGMLRRPYILALERGTPDALDLLVVCSEAGMGLETALERVSTEMARSNRPMAVALAALLNDLRVLPDRREAFANFGTRSGVEGLQRMSAMLGQSLQYGTPLSDALRAVASELRRERMNKLEENAVKLPAMLIFPLTLFIMPSLYVVLLGASILRLMEALKSFASH